MSHRRQTLAIAMKQTHILMCKGLFALHLQQGGLRQWGRGWCTWLLAQGTQHEVPFSTAPEAHALRQEVDCSMISVLQQRFIPRPRQDQG